MSGLIVSVIVVLNGLTGLAVFLRNPGKRTNLYYIAFVFLLNCWIIFNYLENEPEMVGWEGVQVFLRLDFSSAVLFFMFWVLFVASFFNLKTRSIKQILLRIVLGIMIAFSSIAPFFDLGLIENITFEHNVIHFESGVYMPIYLFTITLLMLMGTYMLVTGIISAKREGSPVRLRQLELILEGSGLALGIGLAVNIIQIFLPYTPLEVSRIGLYGMVFLVGFTGFAMVKANFFEIRLSILRTIGALLVVLMLATVYVVILYLVSYAIFDTALNLKVIGTEAFVGAIIIMTFDKIRQRVSDLTRKYFFSGQYSTELVIKEVTRVLIEEVEVAPLCQKIFHILDKELHIDHSAILLLGDKTPEWMAHGFSKEYPQKITDGGIFEQLIDVPCVYDELPRGELRDFFSDNYIAVTYPIKTKGHTIAIFVLGHKLSGEPLSEGDVLFLELLSSEVAMGIQNAISYTEIKKLNKDLEKRVAERTALLELSQKEELAKAQEVARLKDEFVYFASHELRTPITVIRGFLELTLDTNTKFPKDIQENLEAMSQASEHLNQLVNDLLETARGESGKLSNDAERLDFSQVLEKTLHGIKPLLLEKKITLHKDIKDIPEIFCDRKKVTEVLLNLLGNAIKYGRESGNIYVSCYALPEEKFVLVEIRDDGFGIPAERQDKIFQKFFRASTPGTEGILGTGLGLFITRMLVEKMGGKIAFTSTEQKGTTFTFTVPTAS